MKCGENQIFEINMISEWLDRCYFLHKYEKLQKEQIEWLKLKIKKDNKDNIEIGIE